MAVTTTTTTTTTQISTTPKLSLKAELAGKKEEPHIRDTPITWGNWYKHVNWIHAILLTSTPILSIYGVLTTPLQFKTAVLSIIYYYYTGFGITAGYHRLWSHRAYSGSKIYQFFLLTAASGAVQGSARWWCRNHRAHHRYTDTDRDPYSASEGLIYSHMGWMYLKQDPKRVGRADISDLNADPLLRFQHRRYAYLALFFGFVLPTLIPGLGWNDWRGGFFYAAISRLLFVHHATFCVNSLAHYLGDTTYDDKHTPRDHFITAILSLGEGYHNFHHEFPQDYRNAIRFYQYDPTKWLIRICSFFGLTYQLKKFPENEVRKGQVQMAQKKLDAIKKTLNWGTPLNQLPVFTYEEFEDHAKKNNWIVIEGIIHDVTTFINNHPGGSSLITTSIGKDMTTSFNGGVYEHSNAARNLLSTFRVGVIAGGGEVEHRKTK